MRGIWRYYWREVIANSESVEEANEKAEKVCLAPRPLMRGNVFARKFASR